MLKFNIYLCIFVNMRMQQKHKLILLRPQVLFCLFIKSSFTKQFSFTLLPSSHSILYNQTGKMVAASPFHFPLLINSSDSSLTDPILFVHSKFIKETIQFYGSSQFTFYSFHLNRRSGRSFTLPLSFAHISLWLNEGQIHKDFLGNV